MAPGPKPEKPTGHSTAERIPAKASSQQRIRAAERSGKPPGDEVMHWLIGGVDGPRVQRSPAAATSREADLLYRLHHGIDAPIQRNASVADGTSAHAASAPVRNETAIAARGVAGAGAPLPHLEAIQRAFGDHDVRDVRAYVGGPAEAANQQMGAQAYATGNQVAFASAPSLHLAAHEAAHVVQQRGGVQLQGGVGKQGDAYERHADAVADRVAAGEEVSTLLDVFDHRGSATASAVQHRKPKAATPELIVTVDATGTLSNAQGERVGFRGSDGTSYVGVSAKDKPGEPLASTRLGTLRLGHEVVISRVAAATLEPVPQVDAISGGGMPAQQNANLRIVKPHGASLGVTDGDGVQVLERRKHETDWQPITLTALPTGIASKLDEQTRIDLDDGRAWVWMSFALRDQRTETARWVQPAHPKQEVSDRETTIRAEANKLPSGSDVQQAVQQVIKTISVISTVEGDFGSTSQSNDDHGSLGIFQWAMSKKSSKEAGSLGTFFRTLKQRSDAAAAKAAKARTDEDKLFIRAWKQCTDKKLDVDGKQILRNGKPVTGAQVESAMAAEMAKGSLRTYQLIAAKDWIDDFRTTIVRPGPSAAKIIGHGYDESGNGTSAVLSSGKHSFAIDAVSPATVGSLFLSEKAVANAIMLGVNRPFYVPAALWRALLQITDPSAEAEKILSALLVILEPPDAKKKKSTAREYTTADIDAAGDDAKRLYEQLRTIIWPNRALDATAQQKLESDFKKLALKLYDPDDARKYHRERRFAMVEASF